MKARLLAVCVASLALAGGAGTGSLAGSTTVPPPPKQPVAVGSGGAAATVDPLATQAAIRILRKGGNAVDAAVAAAAALGVVEPYSCGIGGGGFMLVYQARTRHLFTIDSREAAPAAFPPDAFIDPVTGKAVPFADLVTSGLSTGVPGTLLAWQEAERRFGRIKKLSRLLAPAIAIAGSGFVVDQTFHDQTADNAQRFSAFASTSALYLPGGEPLPVGAVQRNPDLAGTYGLIARNGVSAFYRGPVAHAIVETVQHPPLASGSKRNVRPGLLSAADLSAYRVKLRPPTRVDYRGYAVFGMGPPSSGGSTVGEALNILEGFDLHGMDRAQALHRYVEASRLAFADRGAYLGDPDFVPVPLRGLLSKQFAAERRAQIGTTASKSPVPPGTPPADLLPRSTTHLTVSDRFGNVVSYTFTIEQTGGNGIVVPGYGFLLNNELTDFETATGLPNSPAAGKRPRSSMSPTIVFSKGKPVLALGSPGGSTIITTVLQILVNRLDFGMTLPEAIAATRISQRNSATTQAEAAFLPTAEAGGLKALGHAFSSTPEIGAATGIEFLGGGVAQAAAEPVRRGGGSAMVVTPRTP